MRSLADVLRLGFLVGMMTMVQESTSIGQIYCFNREECPKIQRIPYDIPPVAPEHDKGILEDLKSILNTYDFLMMKMNKSEGGESQSQEIAKRKVRRIKSLELIYYQFLPRDRDFLFIIGSLLICGIVGSCC